MTTFEMINLLENTQQIKIIRQNGNIKYKYANVTNELFNGTVLEYMSDNKTEFEKRSEQLKENSIYRNRIYSRNYNVCGLEIDTECKNTLILYINDATGNLKNV